jgi:hypothetical protein
LRKKDQLIPLKRLEESFTGLPDAAVEIAYAEGLSATEYIVARFGKTSIRNILELMAQNYNFENAFRTALKLSVVEFESAWQRDLSQ